MNSRVAGIDWCKVIAMLMICSLHYIGHGGVISSKNDIIALFGGGGVKRVESDKQGVVKKHNG